jgi:hypothetical protein
MRHIGQITWIREVYFSNTTGQFVSSWSRRFRVKKSAYDRIVKEVGEEVWVVMERIVGALKW